MAQLTLNNELSITIPDGFADTTKEELKLQNDVNDPNWWAVRNAARRIIIIARWQKYNALMLKLADNKTMIKNNEQKTGKLFANNEYKLRGFFSRIVAGSEAEGFRYSYHVEGIEQNVEAVLIKTRRFVYNLSFYSRAEDEEAVRGLIDEVLDSVAVN